MLQISRTTSLLSLSHESEAGGKGKVHQGWREGERIWLSFPLESSVADLPPLCDWSGFYSPQSWEEHGELNANQWEDEKCSEGGQVSAGQRDSPVTILVIIIDVICHLRGAQGTVADRISEELKDNVIL